MKTIILTLLSFLSFNLFSQYSCATAIPITNGYTSGIISTPGNTPSPENWVSSVSIVGESVSSAFTDPDVYMFKYTTGSVAGESFYFTLQCDYATDGEHSIGVWTGCSGSSLSNCITSTYKYKDVEGVCAQNLLANTTYYIGIGKEWVISASDRKLKFQVIDFTVETSATIPSDECTAASIINVADPYNGSTRCTYSATSGSPSGCGTIENDSWMKFTAGSTTVVIDYSVYNCTNNYGVQLSVFKGSCGALSLLSGSCINYASNNSTGTWTFTALTVGSTYYIRTDGYAGDLCSYAFDPVSGVIILPVELSEFKVYALENGFNKLTWKTQSEINSDYFVLEKSLDAQNFTEVEKIKAAGNSSQQLSYFTVDKAEASALTYYRLKLVDQNGSFYYSDIQQVFNQSTENVKIYPNPSDDGKFSIDVKQFDEIQALEIRNTQGLIVYQEELKAKAHFSLDLSAFSKGIYFVKVLSKNETFERKISIVE